MKAEKVKKSYIRQLSAAAGIFAMLVIHFAVSQFISFQGDENVPVIEVVDKQTVESETQYEAKKPDVVTGTPSLRENVTPISQPETNVSSRVAPNSKVVKETVVKKKEERKSESERLRRVEKFLTGA